MKQKLLFLLLALFAFVFIGCKKLTEFNALGGWRDGGDEVYEITTNTEEKLAFTYDKGDKADVYRFTGRTCWTECLQTST